MSAGTASLLVACGVALLMLVAAVPWWSAGAAARRRAVRTGDAQGAAPHGSALHDGGHALRRGGTSPGVELPVLIELLSAALRSGVGVPRALEATACAVGGVDGDAMRDAAGALRLGAAWDGAWRGAPERLAPLHRALRSAWMDGAASSSTLRAARDEVLHARRAVARTAAARLAVRLVLPLGACFLPAFVLVGLVPVLIALGVDLLSG